MARGSVVITGASSGIGEATAHAFARRGWRLVLGARRLPRLEALRARLAERYDAEAITIECDVRAETAVAALVDAALESFGRLDVIVNNAGVGLYARVEETSAAELRELLEVNVIGVQNGIRAAVPVMRRQRRGHIVVVGSAAGKRSWPFHGPYAATKFALDGLTQALRAELAGSGVTASLILPATTKTEFFARARVLTPGFRPRPIGPVQSAEQVAAMILHSVDHPAPEIDAFRFLRPAYVLAAAFPRLADAVAKRDYSRTARRLPLATATSSGSTEPAAATTNGVARRRAR